MSREPMTLAQVKDRIAAKLRAAESTYGNPVYVSLHAAELMEWERALRADEFARQAFEATGRGPLSDAEIAIEKNHPVVPLPFSGYLVSEWKDETMTERHTWTAYTAEQMREHAKLAVAAAMAGKVLMPQKLTAENGAKAALMGEFSQVIEERCGDCDGEGTDTVDVPCLTCGASGLVDRKILVSWDTIKAIYAAAVRHFHPELP